jgi:hypothetical protein
MSYSDKFEGVAPKDTQMMSDLAEVQERNEEGTGFGKPPAFKQITDKPLVLESSKKETSGAGPRGWGRARTYGFHSTRLLRRLISAILTLAVWLFMAAFLLQFVHTHDDGKSLSERVQTMTDRIQVPLEKVVGFDMRYEFPDTTVDFMPLFVFVALLLLRNRADTLLLRAEGAVKGAPGKVAVSNDSKGSKAESPGANSKLAQHPRKARGDGRAALSARIYSIYSE